MNSKTISIPVRPPAPGQTSLLAFCNNCGASCGDKKDLNRFKRRHPSKCEERAAIDAAKRAEMRRLSSGTRSVDADAPTDWFGDEEARPAGFVAGAMPVKVKVKLWSGKRE